MNILAEFKAAKEKLASYLSDNSKATISTLTELSSTVGKLETGALAQLNTSEAKVTELTGRLTQAEATAQNSTTALTATNSALTAACAALNLTLKADATGLDMVAALQSGVSGTLSKLNVDPAKIPAPAPKSSPQEDSKKKTRADFALLNSKAKMDFMRNGGILID